MMTPRTLNKNSLNAELKSMIEDAKRLPPDGQVYSSGDVKMTHKPQTRMKIEHVLVSRYGKTWRSMNTPKGWSRIDEVSGQV